MNNSSWCSVCGNFLYSSGHKCPPKWLVWDAEDESESDARVIYAINPDDAAELWAERDDSDSAEYSIVSGHKVTVFVKDPQLNTMKQFSVTGESVPEYHASEIDS